MHSPLHLYLRDLIQGSNDFATYALECDDAGGHEVRRLNASIASLKDPSFFRESNDRAVTAFQCVKAENGGSGEEKKSRKVQICCASSDRSQVSRGSTNTLIHRRRRSGRQSRSRASLQARSQKRVFRTFDDEDVSVSSLVSTSQQSLSAPPTLPSSTPISPLSPPMSPSSPPMMSPSSPSSIMDALLSIDTIDDVHRYKSTIRTMLESGLSWKRSSKVDALCDKNEAGLLKMPNISH
jgi:hypothetical protein